MCGGVRAPHPTACAVTLRRGRRPDVPFRTVLVLLCRGGRLCPPCMTAAPCRAGPVCPAVTGEGIRLSSPPSAREVSARSTDGGREATRFSLPQSAAPTAPSQRGPNSAAPLRCHCEARSAAAIRPRIHPSKSQQFPTKFCAPIQNVKIWPETVADVLRRCYI